MGGDPDFWADQLEGLAIRLAQGMITLIDVFGSLGIDRIVIDVDGDGIELISRDDSTAQFEIDDDGFRELTGWVRPDDALLVHDENGDGIINDVERTEGGGLDSQEARCRSYAEKHGYEVDAVFPDDVSGGGDFMKRPEMAALVSFLDAVPETNYVVIFDDLKRFARDTEFHLALRRALRQRGATVECPNFRFEDTPEGKFVETMMAATGELEREQSKRQVKQKMHARLKNGYWVFSAPKGYKYILSKRGGKELVRDEPLASVVIEALEGFASGRFRTQTEVKRFLEANPHYPPDLPSGEIRQQSVVRLLKRPVYAGYVYSRVWKVPLQVGHHTPLISKATHERIRQRLEEGVYAPTRKDIKKDFPLRGAVNCVSCDTPLTAGWSKGKYQKYAYYFCHKNRRAHQRDPLRDPWRHHRRHPGDPAGAYQDGEGAPDSPL